MKRIWLLFVSVIFVVLAAYLFDVDHVEYGNSAKLNHKMIDGVRIVVAKNGDRILQLFDRHYLYLPGDDPSQHYLMSLDYISIQSLHFYVYIAKRGALRVSSAEDLAAKAPAGMQGEVVTYWKIIELVSAKNYSLVKKPTVNTGRREI